MSQIDDPEVEVGEVDESPTAKGAGTSRAACWLHDRGGVGAPIVKETVDA